MGRIEVAGYAIEWAVQFTAGLLLLLVGRRLERPRKHGYQPKHLRKRH